MKLNRKNPLVFRRSSDQSRRHGSVGSRPASRRWRVFGNNYLQFRACGTATSGFPLASLLLNSIDMMPDASNVSSKKRRVLFDHGVVAGRI